MTEFRDKLDARLGAMDPGWRVAGFIKVISQAISEMFEDGEITKDDLSTIKEAALEVFDELALLDIPKVPEFIEKPFESMVRAAIPHCIDWAFNSLFE